MDKTKVKKLIKQIRGVSYKPEDLHDELDDNSVILLRANNIDDGKINFDDVVYVDKSKVSSEQYLKVGDVLICASSGSKNLVGKAASVRFDKECTFGAFCKVVRPNKGYEEYLGVYFQSPIYRRKISEVALGANINNIRNEHIDELDIPLFSSDEQTDIVRKIHLIQGIIVNRKDELVKLDDLIKARFVELLNEGDYSEVSLSKLIIQCKNSEKITDMKNERYITLSSYGKGAHERIIKQGKYPVPFLGYRVKSGQFIYSRIDARNGAYDILSDELDGFVVSKDFPVYDICKDKVSPFFLRQSVLDDNFIKQVQMSSFGATNRMRIKEELLESYTIKLPNISVQNEFEQFIIQLNKSKFVYYK